MSKTAKWEEAWAEFIEAEKARESATMGKGGGHSERITRARLRKARAHIKKLDPDFCDRMDI